MQVARESGATRKYSGERARNAWVTYLEHEDSRGKLRVILDETTHCHMAERSKGGDPSGPTGS